LNAFSLGAALEPVAKSATTAGERRVLADSPSGELVDLSDLSAEERVVSPDLVRRLCVGPEAKDVDPRGIRIKGAHIVQPLDLSYTNVPHPLEFEATTFDATPDLSRADLPVLCLVDCKLPGLRADGIRTNGIRLVLSELSGTVWLDGTKIDGSLDCSSATLSDEAGTALTASQAEISGDAILSGGFSATGAVGFIRTKIGGRLDCSGATLSNTGGIAFSADGAEISGSVYLLGGFRASGAVRLAGAKIGGQLLCRGVTLSNKGGYALTADGAEIRGDVLLGSEVFLGGFSADGGVRLPGAKIGGQLDCAGATLSNKSGYALVADGAEIDGGVFLRHGFSAKGAVSLRGAKIRAELACFHATLVNGADVALGSRDAVIDGALIFRNVSVTGGLDLFRASATTLDDDLGREDDPLGSWSGVNPLVLDGFDYGRFDDKADWDSKTRGRWLEGTFGFQQGAWQQLIEVYRSVGRDDEATRTAIAMHNDRVKRAGLPWYRRWGRQVLRVTVGYGYRPWLAGVWAAAIIVVFALVVWQWSGMFVPETESLTGSPQPVAYATDTFLPIVNLGETDDWVPTGWVRWVDWSVILLGWALSTIFVAGFTRVVRS
jgi:hypothetical protein